MAIPTSPPHEPAPGVPAGESVLSEAVRRRTDLSQVLHRALDRSDNIVILLEQRDDLLSIVAVNDQAQRTTGYLSDELISQPITMLTGPETDPAALEAFLAAAREGRAQHTQLRCRNRAGQWFWFGLHLMPADEPGGVRRFVVLGRDITAKLRQQEQDQMVQGLLAKVFVTVDAPVYIMDAQGRFLMTNPALDRLLGARPGALVGTTVLDRYAPGCHAAIAEKRKQQELDGLGYSVDVVLRTEAGELAGRITGVMVQRPDLARFRIVTIHADAPANAPTATARITAAGRIQLVGLDEVRHTLGPRWAALAERAMATAEHVLRRRLGPRESFSRTEDQGFVVCFADTTEEEAAFRAASIGRELRARLIGEGETAEVAHVLSTATEVPPAEQQMSAADLNALIQDRLNQRLAATQNAARARLHHAVREATYETEAVHSKQRETPIGFMVRLPLAAEQAIQGGVAVLPALETQGLDIDAMLLGFARSCAIESAMSGAGQLVFVTLSSDVLLIRSRLEACLEICRSFEATLRPRLLLIVSIPPGMGAGQLATRLAQLRPFFRSVGVAAEAIEADRLDMSALNLPIQVVDARSCAGIPDWRTKLRVLAGSLQAQRCRLMVRNVSSSKDAAALFADGAEFLSIAAPTPLQTLG